MKDTEQKEESLAAERAAEWLRKLQGDDPEVHAKFGRWLRKSPRHVRDILLASADHHVLKHMKAHHRVDVEAIRARCTQGVREIGDDDVINSRAHGKPEARSSHYMTRSQAWLRGKGSWRAAAVMLFIGFVSLMAVAIHAVSDRTLSTGPGEWRDARLADGSLLRAGPRTTVSLEMTSRHRLVRLVHGEVMVYVAEDRARPFYVETDLVTARAVGTAFAMQLLEPGRAAVIVQDGIVRVSRGRVPIAEGSPSGAVRVNAGEGVTVTSKDEALTPQTVDVERELAWVEQRLVFGADSTIADAVHELNRRNRMKIKLLDSQLGERQWRSALSASDPWTSAQTLAQTLGLAVIEESDELLLIAHSSPENKDSAER